jgi:hypothetical protein
MKIVRTSRNALAEVKNASVSNRKDTQKPRSGVRTPRTPKCVSNLVSQNQKATYSHKDRRAYPYLRFANVRNSVPLEREGISIISTLLKMLVGQLAPIVLPRGLLRLQNHLETNPPILPEEIALLGPGLSEFLAGIASNKDGV